MTKIVLLTLVGFAAHAVIATTTQSAAANPSTSTILVGDTADADAVPQATCTTAWECRICGSHRTQNVLIRHCSDGTETVVRSGPCGEDCF